MFPFNFSITCDGPDEFYDAPGYQLAEKIAGQAFSVHDRHYASSQLMSISPPKTGKISVSRRWAWIPTFSARRRFGNFDMFEVICVGRLVRRRASGY